MKNDLIFLTVTGFAIMSVLGCVQDKPVVWYVKDKKVVAYKKPENLSFVQGICSETDSLIAYMWAEELALKDSSERFELNPKEFYLKEIIKGEESLDISISFVEDCSIKFLGNVKIKPNSVILDYFPETDSSGAFISALCWCRYDIDFKVSNIPYQNTDYEVFMNGSNIKVTRKLVDVMALINASYK
jgi:hypothetical protein